MRELDLVVLLKPFAEHGLQVGDVGSVVHRYTDAHASDETRPPEIVGRGIDGNEPVRYRCWI